MKIQFSPPLKCVLQTDLNSVTLCATELLQQAKPGEVTDGLGREFFTSTATDLAIHAEIA